MSEIEEKNAAQTIYAQKVLANEPVTVTFADIDRLISLQFETLRSIFDLQKVIALLAIQARGSDAPNATPLSQSISADLLVANKRTVSAIAEANAILAEFTKRANDAGA